MVEFSAQRIAAARKSVPRNNQVIVQQETYYRQLSQEYSDAMLFLSYFVDFLRF
jgi:hypothetical protein